MLIYTCNYCGITVCVYVFLYLRLFVRATFYVYMYWDFCHVTAASLGCIAWLLLSCGGWLGGWVFVMFVYCAETANDTAIVSTECE